MNTSTLDKLIEAHQVIINGEKIPIGNTYRAAVRARLGWSNASPKNKSPGI